MEHTFFMFVKMYTSTEHWSSPSSPQLVYSADNVDATHCYALCPMLDAVGTPKPCKKRIEFNNKNYIHTVLVLTHTQSALPIGFFSFIQKFSVFLCSLCTFFSVGFNMAWNINGISELGNFMMSSVLCRIHLNVFLLFNAFCFYFSRFIKKTFLLIFLGIKS